MWFAGAPPLWRIPSLFALQALFGSVVADDTHVYKYRSYSEMLRLFEQLEEQYPDLIDTWVAQEALPGILPSHEKKWADCDGKPCKTLIVRITNESLLTPTTPEVFFSGALHGDESIGPAVLAELAVLLCKKYTEGVPEFRRLLDGRSTWLMPMTNAEGFAHHHREENRMDPNRDFAYLQSPTNCMRTQTGRAVNELFRRHLFQFMITFHGGQRSLSYEWGSKNHMTWQKSAMRRGRVQSTESPDDSAFALVGKQIQNDAGEAQDGSKWYPLDRINDNVYPVDGGMEDWSYGAGWEKSGPQGPITICRPSKYGGYDSSKTKYRRSSIAALVYLVEADWSKTPRVQKLGNSEEVLSSSRHDGHIARNMRMCLRLIELTRPEVVVTEVPPALAVESEKATVLPGSTLTVKGHGFGCLTVQSAKLLLIPWRLVMDCPTLRPACGQDWDHSARDAMLNAAVQLDIVADALKCRGLHMWDKSHPGSSDNLQLSGAVPSGISGAFCLAIAAEFDQEWARQRNPDPKVPPQSHAARLRLEDHYAASANEGHMRLEEFKIKLFPVTPAVLGINMDEEAWQAEAAIDDCNFLAGFRESISSIVSHASFTQNMSGSSLYFMAGSKEEVLRWKSLTLLAAAIGLFCPGIAIVRAFRRARAAQPATAS